MTNRAANRAVFLDRDGTLNVEKNYLRHPDHVVLFPGAGAALKKLSAAGFNVKAYEGGAQEWVEAKLPVD